MIEAAVAAVVCAVRIPRAKSLIPTGAHIFVDESKAKAYAVAASVIAPAGVSAAQKAIAALNRPGQRSIISRANAMVRERQTF